MEAHTWYFLVRNVLQGENTLLTGPTGCGKTAGVGLLAERLGLPLSIFDMGAMHDPITGLLGANRLENGKTFFDYSRFSQVIQQPGIVLLDELSRPAASCNNIIFPLTDDRRELPVEIAASAGVRNIPVHPGCVFIATANVGNEYTGTTKIDRGLLDRFTPLELDYMPQDTEEKMLVKRAGILPSPARIIAKVAATTRRKAAAGELSTAISHRHTLKAAKLVADGFSVISALEMIALPLFESGPDGERAEVKTMIASN
jgi:MoxR-like ATPase